MKIGVPAALLGCTLVLACGGRDNPAGPASANLSGSWTGTSTYPNAPFSLNLTQTGTALRGSYRDGHDQSIAVTGTFSSPAMTVVVDFGDAKLNLQGSVVTARAVEGVMFTSALGNRQYPFTMTR